MVRDRHPLRFGTGELGEHPLIQPQEGFEPQKEGMGYLLRVNNRLGCVVQWSNVAGIMPSSCGHLVPHFFPRLSNSLETLFYCRNRLSYGRNLLMSQDPLTSEAELSYSSSYSVFSVGLQGPFSGYNPFIQIYSTYKFRDPSGSG